MIVQLTNAKQRESGVRFTFGMMNELGINVNLMWASQVILAICHLIWFHKTLTRS